MANEPKAVYATLPATTRGRPIVVGGDPKGKNFLYTNGKSVIIRNIENPEISDIYTQHAVQTTVAKYSNKGFYIASGDVSGKIRIWDTVNKEHILKNEFQPLSGPIKDISWSSDDQRIVVGGEGREKFGHVFSADTGTSVGEISGHSKAINSCDFKPTRPFRIVTASEDKTIGFHAGPPFKFQNSFRDHTNFVNVVRYAPNGELFISGGADGKSFIYDGKTGEKTGELGPAHKGGIYAISFSGDSQQLMSASADKTIKIWDVASASAIMEFILGTQVENMLVGCLWQGDTLLAVTLNGYINYLDKENRSSPKRIVYGHNKPVTAMCLSPDKFTIYTAASDGKVCVWNVKTGENKMMSGSSHSNQIQRMVVCDDSLVTCAMDDTVRISPIASNEYGNPISLDSQPRDVAAASGGLVVVACINHVVVLRDGKKVFSLPVSYEPQSVAIKDDGSQVAVGGSSREDSNIHIYNLDNDTLTEEKTVENNVAVHDLGYSPDGSCLASCDAGRKVMLMTSDDYTVTLRNEWVTHTARVNKLSWTPDGQHIATGSVDTCICIWNPTQKSKINQIRGAHPMSVVTSVDWLDNNTLASVGSGSCIRLWSITHQ